MGQWYNKTKSISHLNIIFWYIFIILFLINTKPYITAFVVFAFNSLPTPFNSLLYLYPSRLTPL
jgi:hypothetical protein